MLPQNFHFDTVCLLFVSFCFGAFVLCCFEPAQFGFFFARYLRLSIGVSQVSLLSVLVIIIRGSLSTEQTIQLNQTHDV